MVRTTVNRSPSRRLPSQSSDSEVNLPPKAAIWTHQVVELPPIMAKKSGVNGIVFEESEEDNDRIKSISPKDTRLRF